MRDQDFDNMELENIITCNEVFRTFFHLTGLSKDIALVQTIFSLGGIRDVSRAQIDAWRKDPKTDRRARHMPVEILRCFFQGLFKYRDVKNMDGVYVFNFLKYD